MPKLVDVLTSKKVVMAGHVKYKNRLLYLRDEIPVIDGDRFSVVIEQIKKKDKPKILQGFLVHLNNVKSGKLYMDNEKEGYGGVPYIPEDGTAYRGETLLTYRGKPNVFIINNVWTERRPEWGYETEHLFSHGYSAMLIEFLPDGGRRYRCNDGQADEDFDDIIFRINPMKKE